MRVVWFKDRVLPKAVLDVVEGSGALLIGQVFDGQLRAEVKTPASGLLSGIRRQPLLFEGDLIAHIQNRQAAAAEAHDDLDRRRQ